MFLESRTKTEQTDVLAQYLRGDKLHTLKNVDGSNLRKLLAGLACEWTRFREKVDEIYDEFDINQTTSLLAEWERVVGIPDDCIGNSGSIEERRTNVLLKLASANVTTAKEFEDLAAIFGFTVVVENGIDTSTLPLTLPLILLDEAEAPFVIVVTLDSSLTPSGIPLTLPFTLTNQAVTILQCLFDKLKPANTTVIFRYS